MNVSSAPIEAPRGMCGVMEEEGTGAAAGEKGFAGIGADFAMRKWLRPGELLRKLGRSGLVFAEALVEFAAEEAVRYRPGDRGTFQRLASSGRSSSESWYSASISFAVFLGLVDEPLRGIGLPRFEEDAVRREALLGEIGL